MVAINALFNAKKHKNLIQGFSYTNKTLFNLYFRDSIKKDIKKRQFYHESPLF